MSVHSSYNPQNDARITVYSKTINVLNSLQLAFVFVSKHLIENQWWKDIASEPISEKDKSIYVKSFCDFTKIAFVQEIFLATESSLRLFLRALDPAACSGSMAEFQSIYMCLLNSKLNATPAEGIQLLDLTRLVRNTIHNNGVYFHNSGNNVSVNWKGKSYEFKQGKAIDFVTWEFLIEITEALRQFMHEVIEDTNLQSISDIIDPFPSN